ncbi:unnamed protein product [Didymodactylos carnosus]|uniref:Phosphoglycerate mutase n=1 Tax=Didymodactylos carnosus TaxID=1234261 RepID=A0A8S2EA65_9BILA|nr:unnamed protein product [Didymodactylos carnosus]CAF3852536.1 unnamed protein product [Didymodactylos carnosus]
MVDLLNSQQKKTGRGWNFLRRKQNSINNIANHSTTNPPLPTKQHINSETYDTDGSSINHHHHHHHHQPISTSDPLVSPQIHRQHGVSQISSPSVSRQSLKVLSPSAQTAQHHQHHEEHEIYSTLPSHQDTRKHIRNSRRTPVTDGTTHKSLPAGRTLSPINHQLPLVSHDANDHHHQQQRHGKDRLNDHLFIHPNTPLKLIFVRHSERANQALGPDWFSRAFDRRTGAYHPYDPKLPKILPSRRHFQAYEFDPPLTIRGLDDARITGQKMTDNNLSSTICLSSTALRCIQTCERLLSGMERRDSIPIRIEPGLFECPHFNNKLINSFMTKEELSKNGYNIKGDYKAMVSKINIPETLDQYFDRSQIVMQSIIDRYSFRGGNILIVTHAPGLVALTDALQKVKSNADTLYKTVSKFQYLKMLIAEFENGRWKLSSAPT